MHDVVLVQTVDQLAHFFEVVFVRVHVKNQLISFGQSVGVKHVYVRLRELFAEDLVFILEHQAPFCILDNHGFVNDLRFLYLLLS